MNYTDTPQEHILFTFHAFCKKYAMSVRSHLFPRHSLRIEVSSPLTTSPSCRRYASRISTVYSFSGSR